MDSLRRPIFELALIAAISVLAGAAINAVRRDRLPMRLPDSYYQVESKAKPILLADARRLFEQGGSAFVDVRPAAAYEEGQIEGAYNLPLDRWQEIYPDISSWIAGRKIVVYGGKDGVRDADDLALALASRNASESLYVYVGGIEEWREARLPVRVGPDPALETGGDEAPPGDEPAEGEGESR